MIKSSTSYVPEAANSDLVPLASCPLPEAVSGQ